MKKFRTTPHKLIGSVASAAFACLLFNSSALGQATLPMQPQQLVVTCFSGVDLGSGYIQNPDGYVLAQYDTREPMPGAVPGTNWAHPASYVNHNDPPAGAAGNEWTARNLGEIFGVTLSDDQAAPDIFVTSTTKYGRKPGPGTNAPAGPAGFGGVYKIDGTNGDIVASKSLPNPGRVGLGNVCFHRPGDGTPLLFVSNFDDGLIYRIDSSGAMTCLNTFDHGIANVTGPSGGPLADDPGEDLTQLGRRIWGVKTYQGRLYYAVWHEDACNSGESNEIWSIELDATTGDFVLGSEYKEFDLPVLTNTSGSAGYSNPVASIEFSDAGKMFVAESGTQHSSDSHRSRVLEYTGGATTAWTYTAPTSGINVYKVGSGTTGNNAVGGVGVNCDGDVWATGDYLIYEPGNRIYGLQQFADGGNETDVPGYINSILIDLDGDTNLADKALVGSLDVFDPCSCLELDGHVQCPTEEGGNYSFDFTVTNTSGQTATSMILHALSGTTGISPATVTFSPPLADGDSRSFTGFDIEGVTPGETACFQVILLTQDREVCCSEEVCVAIPECECFEVIEHSVQCDPATGKATVTVTIRNYEDYSLVHGYLTASGSKSFVDDHVVFDPPVPPFGTATFSFTVCNVLPGENCCVTFSVHSEDLELCCWREICFTCDDDHGGGMGQPDRCDVKPVVSCIAGTAGGTATLTIFNNGPTTKTYNWNVAYLAPSGGCTDVLATSDFTPSSSTVTVPAFSSQTVSVAVNCENITDSCANYGFYVCEEGNPENCFGCSGIVRRSGLIGQIPGGPGPFGIGVGDPAQLTLRLRNTTTREQQVGVEIGDNLEWLKFAATREIDSASPMMIQARTVGAGETIEIPFWVFLDDIGRQFLEGGGTGSL